LSKISASDCSIIPIKYSYENRSIGNSVASFEDSSAIQSTNDTHIYYKVVPADTDPDFTTVTRVNGGNTNSVTTYTGTESDKHCIVEYVPYDVTQNDNDTTVVKSRDLYICVPVN